MTQPAQTATLSASGGQQRSIRHRVYHKRIELAAVGGMALLYACSYFQRVAVPGTIFNQLQSDFSLDAAGVTALASTYLYIYAAMQLVVGFLADRMGGRGLILIGGALLSIGAILFPLAQSPWQLYLTRGLVGLGASTMFLSSVEQIDELFSARAFLYLMGPLSVAGLLGGMAGTWPFERAVAAVGWRSALLGFGGATLAALLLTFATFRKLKAPMSRPAAISFAPLMSILSNPASAPLVVGSSLNFAVYFILQGVIGKKLLEDHGGLSSPQAAGALFAMILIAMGLTFLSGPISQLFGHRRKPLLLLGAVLLVLAMTCGWIGLHRPSGGAWLIAACFVAAACSSLGPTYICAIKEANCPDAVALSVGVVNTTTYIAVAALSHVSGAILDGFASRATTVAGVTVYPSVAYATIFAVFTALSLLVLTAVCFIRNQLD